MKTKLQKLIEYKVTQIIKEETEYNIFFNKMMDLFGVKSPGEFKDENQKKEFFNTIEMYWNEGEGPNGKDWEKKVKVQLESKQHSDKDILTYLSKQPKNTILFGVNKNDIIKLISNSDLTHKWSNDYFNKVDNAINKIDKQLNEIYKLKKYITKIVSEQLNKRK